MVRQVHPNIPPSGSVSALQLWFLSRVPLTFPLCGGAGLSFPLSLTLEPPAGLPSGERQKDQGRVLPPGARPDLGWVTALCLCLLACRGCPSLESESHRLRVTQALFSPSMCMQHRCPRKLGEGLSGDKSLLVKRQVTIICVWIRVGPPCQETERKKKREERPGRGGQLQPRGGRGGPAGFFLPEFTAGPAHLAAGPGLQFVAVGWRWVGKLRAVPRQQCWEEPAPVALLPAQGLS